MVKSKEQNGDYPELSLAHTTGIVINSPSILENGLMGSYNPIEGCISHALQDK